MIRQNFGQFTLDLHTAYHSLLSRVFGTISLWKHSTQTLQSWYNITQCRNGCQVFGHSFMSAKMVHQVLVLCYFWFHGKVVLSFLLSRKNYQGNTLVDSFTNVHCFKTPSYIKSIHFKKTVAQSSFLSKVLSFAMKSKQNQGKWQQF